jgi:LemA protein
MNKKIAIGCAVVLVAVIVIGGLILGSYIITSRNKMVQFETEIDNAWAQVQVAYKRRLDLIPNMVESAKGYMQLEKDIFEAIAAARAGIREAEPTGELERVNEEINSFIDDFKVVVEDTPELKSSETIRDLMTELEGTENRIAVERKRFNDTIRDYNIYIRMFPRNIIAGWFGFEIKEFFEAGEGAETAPEVDLELE